MDKLIKIKDTTQDRLKALGAMGDTYDVVITMLLDEHTARKGKKITSKAKK